MSEDFFRHDGDHKWLRHACMYKPPKILKFMWNLSLRWKNFVCVICVCFKRKRGLFPSLVDLLCACRQQSVWNVSLQNGGKVIREEKSAVNFAWMVFQGEVITSWKVWGGQISTLWDCFRYSGMKLVGYSGAMVW